MTRFISEWTRRHSESRNYLRQGTLGNVRRKGCPTHGFWGRHNPQYHVQNSPASHCIKSNMYPPKSNNYQLGSMKEIPELLLIFHSSLKMWPPLVLLIGIVIQVYNSEICIYLDVQKTVYPWGGTKVWGPLFAKVRRTSVFLPQALDSQPQAQKHSHHRQQVQNTVERKLFFNLFFPSLFIPPNTLFHVHPSLSTQRQNIWNLF